VSSPTPKTTPKRVTVLLRRLPVVSWSKRAWAISAALATALFVLSAFTNRGFLGWGLLLLVATMVLPVSKSKSILSSLIPYAALWFIFTFLRSFADETVLAKTVNTKVPQVERWLFGGELPTIRLQARFFDPNHLHWYDFYFTFVHWSYFIVPHAVAAWMWWKHPAIFRQLLLALTITLSLGLIIYFVIPTNPPWMAPEVVKSPGAAVVTRIMEGVAKELGGGLYQAGYKVVGESNPIAAMPSIHFAVTFMMVWVARTRGRIWPWISLFYAASMGLCLVYMGEHYVVDVFAGGLITTFGWFASGALLAKFGPRFALRPEPPEAGHGTTQPLREPVMTPVTSGLAEWRDSDSRCSA